MSGSSAGTTSDRIRSRVRRELARILDDFGDKKTLVIDPTLTSLLSLVAEKSMLQDHGVEPPFYHMETKEPRTDLQRILYIARPTVQNARMIAEHVKVHNAEGLAKSYAVAFVPRATPLCEQIFEDEGVSCDVATYRWQLMVPYTDDLISLEHSVEWTRELFLDGDQSSCVFVAEALMALEDVFGPVPAVRGKGERAKIVADLWAGYRVERGYERERARASAAARFSFPFAPAAAPPQPLSPSLAALFAAPRPRFLSEEEAEAARKGEAGDEASKPSDLDQALILDRAVDFVTPLVTPMSYEALIDECCGLSAGAVEVGAEAAGVPGPPPPAGGQPGQAPAPEAKHRRIKVALMGASAAGGAAGTLHGELRDVSFVAVGPALNARARSLKEVYEERHSAATLTAMRDYIKRLPSAQQQHKALELHTHVAGKLGQLTASRRFQLRLAAELDAVQGEEAAALGYLEEILADGRPFPSALRYAALCSRAPPPPCSPPPPPLLHFVPRSRAHAPARPVTQGGLKPKQFDAVRYEFYLTYGLECVLSLKNAEKAGLLVRHPGTRSPWPALRKLLRLTSEITDEANPTDASYVHSGYAPVSVRLVEEALKCRPPTWRAAPPALESALGLLPGPSVELPPAPDAPPAALSSSAARRAALVVFVGGVTLGERASERARECTAFCAASDARTQASKRAEPVAALRLVARRAGVRLVVLATCVLGGPAFVGAFLERFGHAPELAAHEFRAAL
eukprot:tig00000042_g15460.t1